MRTLTYSIPRLPSPLSRVGGELVIHSANRLRI